MSNNRPLPTRDFTFVLSYRLRLRRGDHYGHHYGVEAMTKGQSKAGLLAKLLRELQDENPSGQIVIISWHCELDKADWPETGSACRYRNLFDKD